MGRPKALLPVPPGQHPLLSHMLQRLTNLPVEQVIIIANDPQLAQPGIAPSTTRWLPDAFPGCGPLGGIATGLRMCAEWCICLACDLPLVNADVIHYLCKVAMEQDAKGEELYDVVVPVVDGYEQTLHALYHRRALRVIEEQLAANQLRVNRFLTAVRTRRVVENELRPFDPQLRSFLNVNTPEEWAEACKLLEDRERVKSDE